MRRYYVALCVCVHAIECFVDGTSAFSAQSTPKQYPSPTLVPSSTRAIHACTNTKNSHVLTRHALIHNAAVTPKVRGGGSLFSSKQESPSSKREDNGGRITKDKLKKMGTSAILAFAFINNMMSAATFAMAWVGFCIKTGLSPLAPGQWKPFLAVITGGILANAYVKPIQLAASAAMAPYIDQLLTWVQAKMRLNKVATYGFVLVLLNLCFILTAASGPIVALIVTGVPISPGK